MYPREKLIQCFGCKNRLECWGLNEKLQLGKSEKSQKISISKTIKFLLKNHPMSIAEFYGMVSFSLMAGIAKDRPNRRDTYQCVFLLAALSNSSNDCWECPGETETGLCVYVSDTEGNVNGIDAP